jgi:UDP-N-acetylmuramate dehydrogenase
MEVREQVPLSELTTLRVGGPARRLIAATTVDEVVEVVGGADAAAEPLLIIAGGSNLLIGDQGFDGTVLQVALGGIAIGEAGDGVRVVAGAGESWDSVVAACVDEGLAGVECLSGIPGSTGATPIQNVGAYGQDVSQTVVSVSAYERSSSLGRSNAASGTARAPSRAPIATWCSASRSRSSVRRGPKRSATPSWRGSWRSHRVTGPR